MNNSSYAALDWNPRRFAESMAGGPWIDPDQIMLWVSADAVERILSAADNDILVPTPLPLPTSRLVVGLGKPLSLTTGEASRLLINGWRDNAKAAQRMKADLGEVSLVHDGSGIAAVYATDRNSVLVCATEINAKSGAWIDLGFGTVTKDLHFPPGYLGLGAADPEDSRAVSALLRGAWTLYNEPAEVDVTATTVNRESVITGRTAGKRKIRRQEIAIVDIRRRVGAQVERVADADSGERPVVEHDYRWPVRGHWRMQPHGEGRTQRRKIWIDAQVRGPEDKPLKTRPRVSVVG